MKKPTLEIVDRRTHKAKERQEKLKCDRCPPNRGENNKRIARRSWKLRTKKAKQFKERWKYAGRKSAYKYV